MPKTERLLAELIALLSVNPALLPARHPCAGEGRVAEFLASVAARGGIHTVVFGPGNIAQAHTADEWISLRSLERAKKMLVRFLKSLR